MQGDRALGASALWFSKLVRCVSLWSLRGHAFLSPAGLSAGSAVTQILLRFDSDFRILESPRAARQPLTQTARPHHYNTGSMADDRSLRLASTRSFLSSTGFIYGRELEAVGPEQPDAPLVRSDAISLNEGQRLAGTGSMVNSPPLHWVTRLDLVLYRRRSRSTRGPATWDDERAFWSHVLFFGPGGMILGSSLLPLSVLNYFNSQEL
ncbi:hypothetical protein DFH09DRAFT_1289678 [Mycena vulgaris]|nr:hypothetical protein DFH09DRAFT_1289678 [Mycena vulgaris]